MYEAGRLRWDKYSRSAFDDRREGGGRRQGHAHRLSVMLSKDNGKKVRSERVRVITGWDATGLARFASSRKSGITLI